MDDRKALLGELKIDDSQRRAGSSAPRWAVTGAGAVLLAALAWAFFAPGTDPVRVSTALATPADGPVRRSSGAVLDATGYVTARRQATVSSKITGKVREVFIEEGVLVEAGQLLATLDDSTQRANFDLAAARLRAAESRLREVDVRRRQAELDLSRTRELEEQDLASAAALDRDELALAALVARLDGLEKEVAVARNAVEVQRRLLEDMRIRAPFGGVVIAKAAQPGETISPVSAGGGFTRTGICTIVDMDSLEIEVDVNEAYINRVKPAQPVEAMLNSYPDWRIPAEVITIIPTADRSKATVRVRIGFLVRDARILPDMGVRVAFLEEAEAPDEAPGPGGVVIPSSAVLTREDARVVFVVAGDRASVREVELGPGAGSNRNVTRGLKAGERVVTMIDDELAARLDDGVRVITGS